jgi:hypothetical protein
MMMDDWMMYRRNPRLNSKFRHHLHRAKQFDAALCIISAKRCKMMCSSGLQSFVMQMLVGPHRHLHMILSRRVRHEWIRLHLQMKTDGFDFFSIMRDFYVVHPDRYLTQENDLGRVAWSLFFGRISYSHRIERNEQNALVFARVGYQNGNLISGLVLAMLDGDLSFKLLSEYPQKDIYYNIAWAIAFLKKFPVPPNTNIFPFLKSCYTEMKDFLINRKQNFSILPSDNISWVSSLLLDAIFAMSEIVGVGTGVSNCQFRKGDRTMEFQFLTELEIHLWCSMSLAFLQKKECAVRKKHQSYLLAPPSAKSTKSGDEQVVLFEGVFKLVRDGDITIACTDPKDSHSCHFPQYFTKIVFAKNPASGFVTMVGSEVKFWAVENQPPSYPYQKKISLVATLHLPKVIGFHLIIDVCSMSSKYIVLWSRTSELVVIPFTFTWGTVSIGEKTIFSFERVRYITLIDESRFNIYFNRVGTYGHYLCILDCSGELPILQFP